MAEEDPDESTRRRTIDYVILAPAIRRTWQLARGVVGNLHSIIFGQAKV